MWDNVRQHNYKLVREVAGIATQPEKANSCDDLAWYDILTSLVWLARSAGVCSFVCLLAWSASVF